MATPAPLTEDQRAQAAADAERQVRRTLDRHFRRPTPDRTKSDAKDRSSAVS